MPIINEGCLLIAVHCIPHGDLVYDLAESQFTELAGMPLSRRLSIATETVQTEVDRRGQGEAAR